MEKNFKNNRPQSSISLRHLPNLTHRKPKVSYPKITSTRDINRNDYNPHKTFIPKLESENIYKNNIDLKQTINDLNRKIDFLKANNQKLSLIISKKDKEIDELTNQIILKNKELVTKEKKERLKEKKNIDKEKTPNKNDKKNINKKNNFEKDLELKKIYNEISLVKEKYNKAIIELRNKEEEILNLKRNKNLTDYNELKIRNEVLTQEFDKLREMYLLSLDMNKKNENFGRSENLLKDEIQTQHGIITELKNEIDLFSLERKHLNDVIADLKNKLELAYNNNKFMKNQKELIEKRYKKNIKEQVLKKEYEEEKQQMITKIYKLEKSLNEYMLKVQKNNNYEINKNKKEEDKNNKKKDVNNGTSAIIISGGRNGGITTRIPHPEENYDSKTLLMQSIITELTNEKKELLDKIKMYEEQIKQNNQIKIDNNSNNNLNKENNSVSQPQNSINNSSNLLKTTEEILIADNNQNLILNDADKKEEENKEEKKEEENKEEKKEEEKKEEENKEEKKEEENKKEKKEKDNKEDKKEEDNNDDKKEEDNNDDKIEEDNNDDKKEKDNKEIKKEEDNREEKKEEDNKEENKEEDNNDDKKEKVENENSSKEEIKFDDILSLNFEYNNINSTNAKDLFNPIFAQFENEDKNSDTYKESILSSLVNEISLKLNCASKEDEKKEMHQNIQLLIEQDENLEDNFYIIFDDIINHNEEERKKIDNEYESIIKEKFKEGNNKNSIEEIINNNENKMRIDHFYDILNEKNIKLEKKVFLYLCYKLKTKDCDSLYDIETKELSNYIN